MLPSTTATDSPSRRFRRGSKRSSASVRVMPLSISRVLEHRSCCTFPSKQWFPLLQGMKGAYHTAQVSAAAVHVCVYAYVYVKILVADLYIYIYIYLFIYNSLFIIYLSIFFIVIQCPENWRVCYESVGVSPQDFKHGKIMEALRPFLLAASLESCTKVTSACSSWSQLDCSKENSGNSWKFTQNDGY